MVARATARQKTSCSRFRGTVDCLKESQNSAKMVAGGLKGCRGWGGGVKEEEDGGDPHRRGGNDGSGDESRVTSPSHWAILQCHWSSIGSFIENLPSSF